MALRPGATISGKVGAEIFSRNRGGEYIKTWRMPTNPNSPAQATSRSKFGGVVSSWSTLSEAQQSTWEAAAPYYQYTNRIGEKRTYSAQQLFIRCNSTLEQNGEPQRLTIGASPVPYTIGSFTQALAVANPPQSTAGLVSLFIAFFASDDDNITPDERIVLYSSAPVSSGIRSVRSVRLRKTAIYTADDIDFFQGLGEVNILADYNATWNNPMANPGQRVFLQWRLFNTKEGWLHPYGLQRCTFVASL